MIWLSRIMFDISGALSLRGSEAAEVGKGDAIDTRTVLVDDVCRSDTVTHGIQRLLTDLDRGRHRPGIFDQRRKSQRRDDESDLVEARQPPGLHHKSETLDALIETELLRRCDHLPFEGGVAWFG